MNLQWKKYPVLNDGFICLVDSMGDDSSIVQAARKSYGKDECDKPFNDTDRKTLRHMMREGHTSPFEMVEFKFLVRVPMDCWRQWIRHRTANVNEYSTRYTEAIDSQQKTDPSEWRLQATDNKQGSGEFLVDSVEFKRQTDSGGFTCWESEDHYVGGSNDPNITLGEAFSIAEKHFLEEAVEVYTTRLSAGIAKEQARKDLPLSTYTEAYWKCDLHNIFNFLRLRLDSHAQLEIRLYAQAMAEIVKQVVPVTWEAFEDYVLNAKQFSAMEMQALKGIVSRIYPSHMSRPVNFTDREWKEFLEKLQ